MRRLTPLALGAATALAYVVAARAGFEFAVVAEQVTTVWAPTGIALAALLLGGIRLWPAVWIGAFVANAGSAAPLWTALAIASGNTLEAVAAVWLLGRIPRFDVRFDQVPHVLAFMGIAAAACTAISATVGVLALCAAHVQPWERFGVLWFDWWLGDALGALIVAPAILAPVCHAWSRADAARTAVLVVSTIAVAHVGFRPVPGQEASPLEFVVFPVVITAAVVGGAFVTPLAVLSASGVALWHTAGGEGPFTGADGQRSLLLLQVFMGVLAGTAMLLAAAIAERRSAAARAHVAAEALAEREEMLRLAQRAGGVATFDWDFGSQVARCSAEFFRIFGLPARDGVMTGAEWERFVHPDDRDRMAAHLARALGGAEAAEADYRIIAADGNVRWVSYAGQLQRTLAGDRLLGTAVDVTHRKHLEAELRRQAAEVERILESIGEGFVSLDREFHNVYANHLAEEMLRRSRAELIGRTPWDVFPDEAIRESRQHLEEAMATGTARRFEVLVPGWNRWYETRVYPSPAGLSVFFADVTSRLEAETALRESREVLALAMRGGLMGMWSRDFATNQLWWSRELEDVFGLVPGTFPRTEAAFFEYVHPDDREPFQAAIAAALENGTEYGVEFRFVRADGEWRWMEGRGRAVYDEQGRPRSLYGIGIDVTARKRTELDLQEANRLKDEFLATLSHELRTPLNAVLGWTHMLREGAMQPPMRDRALESLERNAKAQAQLVEDLLDVSRIMAGKLQIKADAVDLGGVIVHAVDTVRAGVAAKGLRLNVNLPADRRLMVTGDGDRLQQIIWNLVSNAIKFTPAGGAVEVELRQADSHAEIVVRDTGQGIAPSFQPHLFERFRQMDASKTRRHGGLGLGLSIVRHLTEAHGGTVTAESEGEGCGATFLVRLPLQAIEACAADAEPSAGDAVSKVLAGMRVLVVDDDADARELMRYVLQCRAADVVTADSAGEALHLLARDPFDVLIADIGMPEQDGLELIRIVRGLPATSLARTVPAIAVTAYAGVRERAEALEAGFEWHLGKPIDPEQLVAAILLASARRAAPPEPGVASPSGSA